MLCIVLLCLSLHCFALLENVTRENVFVLLDMSELTTQQEICTNTWMACSVAVFAELLPDSHILCHHAHRLCGRGRKLRVHVRRCSVAICNDGHHRLPIWPFQVGQTSSLHIHTHRTDRFLLLSILVWIIESKSIV